MPVTEIINVFSLEPCMAGQISVFCRTALITISFCGTALITISKLVWFFFFSSVDYFLLSSCIGVFVNCNFILNHFVSKSAKPHSHREKIQ